MGTIFDKLFISKFKNGIHAAIKQKPYKQGCRKNKGCFKLAINGANLGMWDWNVQTGEVKFNKNLATILGYEPNEIEPNVNAWKKIIHPEDRSSTITALTENLEGRKSFYECEYRLLSKTGEWKWVLARGRVVEWAEDGKPLRHAGTYLDIQDRVEVRKKLENRCEEFEQLVETRIAEFKKKQMIVYKMR